MMSKLIENLIYMAGATKFECVQSKRIHYKFYLNIWGIADKVQQNRLLFALQNQNLAPYDCQVFFE